MSQVTCYNASQCSQPFGFTECFTKQRVMRLSTEHVFVPRRGTPQGPVHIIKWKTVLLFTRHFSKTFRSISHHCLLYFSLILRNHIVLWHRVKEKKNSGPQYHATNPAFRYLILYWLTLLSVWFTLKNQLSFKYGWTLSINTVNGFYSSCWKITP